MRKTIDVALLTLVLAAATTLAVCAPTRAAEAAVPDEWNSLDGQGLVALAKQLAAQGDTAKDTRAQLVDFVAGKYLTDSERVRSLTCYHWRELAWYLRSDVSKEVRAAWAEKLLKAFAGTREQLLGLDGESFAYLARAVAGHLGGGGVLPLAVTYVAEKDAWQSLNLFELDWLALMAWQAGATGHAARQRLVGHLTSTQFDDVAKVRAAGVTRWSWFTFYLAGGMSDETRDVWAGRLCEAFAGSPEAVASLTDEETQRLESTLRSLCGALPPEARRSWFVRIKAAFAQDEETLTKMVSGEARSLVESLSALDRRQAAELALKWFATRSDWRSAPAADLVTLAYVAAEGDPKATAPLMGDLEQVWLAADTKEPLDLSAIYCILRTWSQVGNDGKARAWVTRAYTARLGAEEDRNTVDLVSLGRLAEFMRIVGLTGKDKGYPGFAAALARHAREGTLADGLSKYAPRTYWAPCDPVLLGLPLGTPETRRLLEDDLIDAVGAPRLGAAQVLAWAYRHVGELGTWRRFVDAKAESSDGDAKALWLVAQAYNEALRADPPNPLRMNRGLDAALAACASDRGKLTVLLKHVAYYRSLQRPGFAADLLESVRDQLGEEGAAQIASIVDELRREETARKGDEARARETAATAQKTARLKYYRRCLARAQAEGAGDAVTRIQTAIAELEAALAP